MALVPESLVERLSGTVGKVKQVNPAAAKTSAVRGTATIKETIGLSVGYLKQETTDPLKHIVRYLFVGMFAAVLSGSGFVLLCLAVLRLLQRLTDPGDMWSGSLTWLPYLLTIVFVGVLCAVTVLLSKRSGKGL